MSFFSNLFNHGQSQKAHEQMYDGDYGGYGRQDSPHKSSWTEETVAAAAGFAAMKAYEDHVRNTGEQLSHPMMKEMLAGFATAEVDKLFETHGLDFLDREQAKRRAVHQAHHLAEQKYGSGSTFGNAGGDGYQRGQGQYTGGGYQQDQGQYTGGGYQQNQGQYTGGDYQQNQGQYTGGGYQQNPGQYTGGDYQQNQGQYTGGSGYQQRNFGGDQFGGGGYQQQSDYATDQFGGRGFGQGGEDEPRREHHRHHHREEED